MAKDTEIEVKELDEINEIISPSTVTIYNNARHTGKIAVNEKCDKFKMIVGRLALVACQCCMRNEAMKTQIWRKREGIKKKHRHHVIISSSTHFDCFLHENISFAFLYVSRRMTDNNKYSIRSA